MQASFDIAFKEWAVVVDALGRGELERTITAGVTPVLTDAEFAAQRDEICELLSNHALAHP